MLALWFFWLSASSSILLFILPISVERLSVAAFNWPAISFLCIVIVSAAGWGIYRAWLGIPNQFINTGTVGSLTFAGAAGKVPWILYDLQKHIFGPKKWNLIWLFFYVGLFLNFRKAFSGNLKYITMGVILPFLGYSAVQIISTFEIKWLLSKTGSRLLLHYMPVAVFWLAYLVNDITGQGEE